MLRRKILTSLAITIFLSFLASTALAGTTSFNVIVPSFGRCANTSLTTKNTTTNAWAFYNLTVGGSKTLRFRPLKNNSPVGNFYDGTTGSYVWGPYTSSQGVGAQIYGQICTKSLELVNVQVLGTFDSN